jgi:hypothetical protein
MAKQKYSDPELAAILDVQLKQSLGAPTSEISLLRLRNLQYYRAEAIGELAPSGIPDRSQVVASDVADTVEWMLPSIMRVFASSQDALKCDPKHPRFAPQAKLASEYLRHVFWKKNDGFDVLHEWFRDALIQKVGFIKVYWDEEERDVEETYKGLLPEQLDALLKDADDIEPIEQESRVEVIGGQSVEVFDVRVKLSRTEARCVTKCVPPEEMRIHPRARYGDEPVFIAQQFYRTRQDLEADGFDLTHVSSEAGWSLEEIERANTQTPYFFDSSTGELERFKCSECYIQLDDDEDGVAEWLRVFMIGSTVLEREKVPDHPFVWFCPTPLPHAFFGLCPADMAIEPQRLRTSLMRSMLDNVYLSVNQRTEAVEGQVNLDDLLVSRPGGVVRVKAPGMLRPLPQGGLDNSAWQMVEWAEQWRETRTGYTRYSQGLNADALNPTATGVSIITEKADQRIELICRVAAQSVRRMFEKILACMCRYQQAEEIVELMGQWTPIDPREWADGYQIHVEVGLGTGSKDKRAMVLHQVMQIQAPMAQAGVLPPQAVIAAARAFTEAGGISGAEEYFPDPPPPKQPGPSPDQIKAQAQMQIEQAKLQAQGQLEQFKAQLQQQTELAAQQAQQVQVEAQARIEAESARIKAQLDAQLEAQRIEFDRYKTDADNQTRIIVAQISAGARQQRADEQPVQQGI